MKLFETANLGPLRLRNRIVMPPMAVLFGNRDGTVSERTLAYYARRARGGAGLIIVENTAVDPGGVNYPGTLEIHAAKFEPGLGKLASIIKGHGAAAALQLFHPGRQIHPKFAGNYPIAPSPIPCPVMGGDPHELEVSEIRGLVKKFVEGAARAKAVGFDAVEIHGAHGYLVAQFLSPFSNRRNDDYGGDAARRARFAGEIIQGIREKLGPDFPIILRISAEEKVEGGLTLAQTKEMIPFLEQGLAALHVSAGCYPSMEWVVQPYLQPRGCLVELAKAMRGIARVPIVTVGRINSAELAESILEQGAADFVALGRALIADPDLPNQSREGKAAEVRPCIACNVCIEGTGTHTTRCAVNPEVGHESESFPRPPSPKKILVVGGGPGGMEAALTAHARGHRVLLAEAGEALGGQLVLAGIPESKLEIRRLLAYYRFRVEQSGLPVILNQRVDLAAIKDFAPDQVILATGAAPVLPEFDLADSAAVIPAMELLKEKRKIAGRAVVIGGGPLGLDAADYLVAQGATVTVLEMKKRVGEGLEWNVAKMRIRALKKKGVTLLVKSPVVRVQADGVVYLDAEGVERMIEADQVIFATGSAPFNPMEAPVGELGLPVTVIGDAQGPRGLAYAIGEGFIAGMKV